MFNSLMYISFLFVYGYISPHLLKLSFYLVPKPQGSCICWQSLCSVKILVHTSNVGKTLVFMALVIFIMTIQDETIREKKKKKKKKKKRDGYTFRSGKFVILYLPSVKGPAL